MLCKRCERRAALCEHRMEDKEAERTSHRLAAFASRPSRFLSLATRLQVLFKNDFRPSARKSFVSGFAAGRKSYPQGVRTKEFFLARCARACVSGPLRIMLRMHALLSSPLALRALLACHPGAAATSPWRRPTRRPIPSTICGK